MKINPVFLISGAGMIAVGAGYVLFWARRAKVSSVPFLLGATAWFASVGLKAGFAIAFNKRVQGLLAGSLGERLADPLFWLYVGLLTGVFECGLVLLLTLWPKIRDYDFNNAVAFGAGFGAVEAALLGLASLSAVVAAMAMPDKMPKASMDGFSGNGWIVLAPILERAFAVMLHIFACALIIVGARQRKWSFFWCAFVYKTLVDAVAAWGQLSFKLEPQWHVWAMEAIVAVFGIAGYFGLKWLSVKDRVTAVEAPLPPQTA